MRQSQRDLDLHGVKWSGCGHRAMSVSLYIWEISIQGRMEKFKTELVAQRMDRWI